MNVRHFLQLTKEKIVGLFVNIIRSNFKSIRSIYHLYYMFLKVLSHYNRNFFIITWSRVLKYFLNLKMPQEILFFLMIELNLFYLKNNCMCNFTYTLLPTVKYTTNILFGILTLLLLGTKYI
jgi:hypothetical protein